MIIYEVISFWRRKRIASEKPTLTVPNTWPNCLSILNDRRYIFATADISPVSRLSKKRMHSRTFDPYAKAGV